MADFGAADLDAFRAEVRAWLEANYPAELRDPTPRPTRGRLGRPRLRRAPTTRRSSGCAASPSKGWTAPTWPKEYGGGGLRRRSRPACVDQEIAAGRYRPPLLSFGIWMLGPVLLEYANEAQKTEHLPKIVRGEIRWCQGYSEPGAGSDLASLRHPVRGQGRPLADQRPEDLDELRRQGRLVLLPGAHRHHQEARGHLLRADRHALAGRRDAADQADQRREPVLRDLLHRREDPQGQPGRQAQRRLGHRQAAAAVRAPEHLRRLRRGRRRRAARPATWARWPSDYVGVDGRQAGRRRPAPAHHRATRWTPRPCA